MEAAENLGITPAYTGNTDFFNYLECNPWDHPRIHGEHSYQSYYLYVPQGSPPHTRGTLLPINEKIVDCRITPAYTGNTESPFGSCGLNEDHPRIHGEHRMHIIYNRKYIGSPPHTRGTPIAKCQKLMS